MFERNVVSKKEDNVIAETEGTEPKSNRVIKSTDTFEDDEYHRSVKAIGLMRNNQYNGRRECGDGQLGNRKNNQYG